MTTDWSEWHDAYARPGSGLGDRLAAVRAQIDRRLDATAPDPVRAVSLCAGDGRDVLGVLAERPEVAFVAPDVDQWSVGVHRLAADPRLLEPGSHWFTFFR